MRVMIVYSSQTGNTRKIAEVIKKAIPDADLYPVETLPSSEDYDLVFLGFWVDKGTADKAAARYMETLVSGNVALFATLGAYPDSDHARESIFRATALIPGCRVLDSFICQGAIDPRLQERMRKLPPDHPHAVDDRRLKRWKDASSHPDEEDCLQAELWARGVLKQI
jgi:flavodoxin